MGSVHAPAGRTAHEVLSASRDLVEPALRDAVDTLPDSMRHIAGYHLGWWDRDGDATGPTAGGKALRPTLALLTATATGTETTAAIPAAVAVELAHNSTLLHDDVIDGDHTRRHRPTVWSVFGVGNAILAGDALLMLASDVLADADPHTATPASRILGSALQRLFDGQIIDLSFEQRSTVDLATCERMSLAKTGALTGCACALGCVLAGGDAERVEWFTRFGEDVGLAFQHTDDLLGIWGDPDVTGKPVYSDLRNRKKSLPVVYALSSDTRAGRELAELFQRDAPASHDDLARAARLVDDAGGRAWCRSQSDALLARALGHLRSAAPHPAAEAELTALAEFVVHRDR